MNLKLHVPSIPVAQPRARATSIGGKARMFEVTAIKNADGSRKPHPIAAFKATVRHAAMEAYKGPPLEQALSVSIVFVFPRPSRLVWKSKPMPRVPHTVKPDRDNCDKACLDALKGLLWRDDCQICAGSIEKWYASGDEQPHVMITVETVG